ncbi:hypothetical protein [Aureimonas glaciei]|uniref:Uncharacterized protein n=1 Tax=Aureimonas glaciei TaxID=1776957 RepID=A0A917DHW8_9HYPH|nr:hypothetical protein [Aureimonas glaciei]GGD41810.1 hypothetical protein GCM10011335_50620 [Aureimonas glaciei]
MRRHLAIGAVFALFNGTAIMCGAWAIDRTPATDTQNVEVIPASIMAGSVGEVRYMFQRFRLCERKSTRFVIDSTNREFMTSTEKNPSSTVQRRAGRSTFVQPFTVPIAAKPGAAVYRVRIEDYCNPIHRLWPITKTIEAPFQIAPALDSRSGR